MGVYLELYHDTDDAVPGASYVVAATWGKKGDGPITIGHDCATAAELNYILNQMIKDIEGIRAKAPAHFEKARKKRFNAKIGASVPPR